MSCGCDPAAQAAARPIVWSGDWLGTTEAPEVGERHPTDDADRDAAGDGETHRYQRADEVVFYQFACTRCGAPMSLAGRLVLTPDRRQAGITFDACGNESFLTFMPPASTGVE